MIKNIFILWFQGFENAPHLVQQCVKSWKFHNQDWTIHLLDNTNIHTYITIENDIDLSNHNLEYSHKSDIIRLLLLKKYGGLWVDATVLCRKPLHNWLPEHIIEGFFVFNSPVLRDRIIANWFIYSECNNIILLKWSEATINYFKINMKAHTYFIIHYLFSWLYNSNVEFHQMWDKVIKRSSRPSFLFRLNQLLLPLISRNKEVIDTQDTPVYKLTHRYTLDYNYHLNGSNVEYLYNTTFR
jgi:hypothetical protein